MRHIFQSRHWRLAAATVCWMIIIPVCGSPGTTASIERTTALVDVPVRKVMLFSSGVGYFEHIGVISGDSHTELRFKTTQINDILKSLVIQDLDGGRAGMVVYPAQEPLTKTLGSFQVDLSNNPSLAEILTQVRGSQVKVMIHAEQLQGTILGLEKRPLTRGDQEPIVEVWVLNLVAGGSVRSVPLDEVERLELEDIQLQEELHNSLLALAQARDQAKKPMLMRFEGMGDRRVRLGYIIETPIWKTSYRLLLAENLGEPAKIQGWAMIENQTDNDWTDAHLSLVSGRPISFVQELYAPLYLSRPVVKPELHAGLRPQTYESGLEPLTSPRKEQGGPISPPSPGVRALAGETRGRTSPESKATTPPELMSPDQPLDPISSVIAAASTGQVGELFEYSVGQVSLPRQRSAMLPILVEDIAVERISIYNRSVLAQYPLNGARLTNTTGKLLLQGPITVFDANTYGGDGRIDNVPPGQERLISYAIDLDVRVQASNQRQESSVQTGKLVRGVLQLTRKNSLTQNYTVDNKANRDRVLILEHPVRPGWKVVESPELLETTDTWYRFRRSLAAGKAEILMVKEEIIQGETIAILPSDLGQVESYSRMGEIPKEVREALVKAFSLKSALVDSERQMQERQQRLAEIRQDQQRIRENMATVNQTSQYYTRLLTKLNDQETAIEKLQGEIEQFTRTYDLQRQELETFLMNTTAG